MLLSIVREKKLTTTLRVVGGWVRDKLMGLESNDIDFAIDSMPLEEFAQLIDEHMNAEAAAAQTDHQYQKAYSLRKANTENMKSLSIITISHPCGLSLDFVNLEKDSNGEPSPM